MTAPREETRIERKFVLRAGSAAVLDVDALVHRLPVALDEVFAPRLVNSLYFDSPELRRYQAHRAGLGDRTKLRIRWYGAFQGSVRAPVIEIKERIGDCGRKRRAPLPGFHLDERLALDDLLAPLRSVPSDDEIAHEVVDAAPVLFTRYARRYFQTADRRVRLTIDTRIELSRVHGGHVDRAGPISVEELVVVELKFAPADVLYAAAIGRALPARMTKMSKYVLGVERLGLI